MSLRERLFRMLLSVILFVCIQIGDLCAQTVVQPKTSTDIRAVSVETLDRIIEAYVQKSMKHFIAFISDDYFEDKTILETELTKARSLYTNIDIKYTEDSIITDQHNKIFLTVTFTRRYTDIRTGKTSSDNGSTSFILRSENGQWRVLSMTKPFMFFR